MKKFSVKVSNDKKCNCTVIPYTLLIGYHLVLGHSEFLAPPQISQFGEMAEKFSNPAVYGYKSIIFFLLYIHL